MFRTCSLLLTASCVAFDESSSAAHDNSRYCLAKPGEIYLVYLPDGGSHQLDLSRATGRFSVEWFNPRVGGPLSESAVKRVSGGTQAELGQPPSDSNEDWLAVIRKVQ